MGICLPFRGSAATSRYYGSSNSLLEQYASIYKTYESRILPCGSLLPNDLGCSDMLGNVWECCQDHYTTFGTEIKKHSDDNIIISQEYNERSPRVLRGGSFFAQPSLVRSAYSYACPPAFRSTDYGFRPARTYP